MNKTFLIINSIALFFIMLTTVSAKAIEPHFLIKFENAHIAITPQKEQSSVKPSIQVGAENYVLSYGDDWEIKQLNSEIIHLRNKLWKDFYWRLNISLEKVYKVQGRKIDSLEDEGTLLENVKVEINNQYNTVLIRFLSAYFEYDPTINDSKIIAADAVIVANDSLEVKQIDQDIYHVRHKWWEKVKLFWKIDLSQGKIYKVKEGKFGLASGSESLSGAQVLIIDGKIPTFPQKGVANSKVNKSFENGISKTQGSSEDKLLSQTSQVKMYEDAIARNPYEEDLYEKLSSIYIRQGDFKKALATYLSNPLFKKSDNKIRMSNIAFKAAVSLWRVGAIDESIPLFIITANSDTGSESEMLSLMILAYLKNDYHKALNHARRIVESYNDGQGYREYMTLLHLFGYHEDAWNVLDAIDIPSKSPDVWTPIIIGHRMESKEIDEINKWLLNHNELTYEIVGSYILTINIEDRIPNEKLPETIEKISSKFRKLSQHTVESKYEWFARAYSSLVKNKYSQAFEIFNEQANGFKQYNGYMIPSFVLSAVKSNHIAEIKKFYDEINVLYNGNEEENISNFFIHLSKAYFYGLQGDHQKAVNYLKSSSYRIPPTGNDPISPWYQLVQTCERLYSETNNKEYIDLALKWAKLYQRIKPMFAWAYAVEAKYTKSDSDRLRALALTLYLDKGSEHISDFSKQDKDKALEWLKINNPFLRRDKNEDNSFKLKI